MGNAGRDTAGDLMRDLPGFARRFWQVMSDESGDLDFLSRPRYWEFVRALSHLERALDQDSVEDPDRDAILLRWMRVILDGFAGRRVEPGPHSRARSVEERHGYVQWGNLWMENPEHDE